MPDDKAFQKQLTDIEKKKIEMGTNDKYNDKMTISDVPKSKNTIKINSNSTTTSTTRNIEKNDTCSDKTNENDNNNNNNKDTAENDENEAESETVRIRGYKLTTDGRKTTFFNNEMDEQTKALIGDIAPQKILHVDEKNVLSVPGGGSAWNAAGTFESVDHCKYLHYT